MRTFVKVVGATVLAVLVALAIAAVVAFALVLEPAPRVPARGEISAADVDRAVAIVRRQDPRRAPPGQLRWLALAERDVDLLADHAAARWLGAHARVRLEAGRVVAQASAPAPFGRWLNVEAVLRQTDALPAVERLRVGRLPLPPALALPVLRALAARAGVQPDMLDAAGVIERVTLAPGRVVVSYRLGPQTLQQLRAGLVAPAEQQRLRAYVERLADAAARLEGRTVSLAQLLPPLLALAAERSDDGADAVAENRAALLVLAFHATHRPLRQIVPAADAWPAPRPLVVTLQQRHDFALHFVVSALIAAQAGTPLADAVGLWKELDDARRAGGSGFSFADLAADRAGTRFGDLAVREPRQLQARIARGLADADLMPDARDLPEFLPEREFAARYGGVGGAGYERLRAEIEARIDALPLME
ncbi:MAG: hypothetical protein MUE62_06945 [Burkholderiaceae bacterium]|jgi:hypothetical protein|nr:hypothetical protein [Burkholderiaceae bacterium]